MDGLQRLAERWRAGPSDALKAEIAQACLPLCKRIARRFSGRGAETEDLQQVAALACLRALEGYDPAQGVPFEAWAARYAVGAARNHLRDHAESVRIPRTLYERTAQLTQARSRLTLALGREPTVSELSGGLGWTAPQTTEVLAHLDVLHPLALDAEENAAALPWLEPGFSDLEKRHDIQQALDRLQGHDRELISLRYFDGLSQRDAARRLNMTQMQVHRAERRILALLRERLETA